MKRYAMLFLLTGLSNACQKSPSSEEGGQRPASTAANPALPAADETSLKAAPAAAPIPEGASELAATLDAYDAARAQLAADAVPAEAAERLVSEAQRRNLEKLQTAARTLADETDLERARLRFGDVSASFIEALKDDPLRTQVHVYECPMAKGFRKWVQKEPKMANPYMGTRMLECGAKVEL